MNEMKHEALKRQRLRFLYSLGDFQMALSAADFLAECDPEQTYSKIQLRRFRCYETTMIVAYARPFSDSKGEIPRLGFKMVSATLSHEQKALHKKLIQLRNKVIAHSDADMMRILSKAHSIKLERGLEIVAFETVFDEGLTFIGPDLRAVNDLIHIVFSTVFTTLYEEAQKQPGDFNLRKDYLND